MSLNKKYEVYVGNNLFSRHLTSQGAVRELQTRFKDKAGKVVKIIPTVETMTVYTQGGN